MYRYKDLKLRKFSEEDIPYKVEWVNNPANNKYLQYELPLTIENTQKWYGRVKNDTDRWDATLLYKGKPVGTFGLLNIDRENKTAEDYSLIGDESVKGMGLGTRGGILNLCYAFYDLGLDKVWGIIEVENEASLRRWKRVGGIIEKRLYNYFLKS